MAGSIIRRLQAQIGTLIVADDSFAVAPSAEQILEGAEPDDTRASVIIDVPGDIDTVVDKALAAVGIGVIVWTPSYNAVDKVNRGGSRKYTLRIWVKENVTLNRARTGALTAEELVEKIDLLVHHKPNSVTPRPQFPSGYFRLADAGAQPIGGPNADSNDWEITFETETRIDA
jgi:hypothetical protein